MPDRERLERRGPPEVIASVHVPRHALPRTRLGAALGAPGLIYLLSACPAEAPRELGVTADTLPTAPPIAEAPPAIPPAEEVILIERDASGVGGVARIAPEGPLTRVALAVHGAPPGTPLPVRLHVGSCAEQGPERAALDPVLAEADGTGAGESMVELPAHDVLSGQHYVQLYQARGELHRALACGDIPARADLHPGLDPAPHPERR